MRIVFFGTPEFATPSLHRLVDDGHQVVAVVTQPDRSQGRSRSSVTPPPVKIAAQELGLEVLQPDRPAGDLFVAALRRMNIEVGVVVAYGHILRPEILEVPPAGLLNVHASLLPRWRGAAPVQHTLLAGDPVTGISIMRLDEGMDTGPVVHRLQTTVRPGETTGELTPRLAELGAMGLTAALEAIERGTAEFEPQDDEQATYAPKVTRSAARIDWRAPADQVARQSLAYDPVPGAWALLGDSPIKLFRGEAIPATAEPGTILAAGDRLLVACGTGAVALQEVQPAGKRRLPAADWVRGHSDLTGRILE